MRNELASLSQSYGWRCARVNAPAPVFEFDVCTAVAVTTTNRTTTTKKKKKKNPYFGASGPFSKKPRWTHIKKKTR